MQNKFVLTLSLYLLSLPLLAVIYGNNSLRETTDLTDTIKKNQANAVAGVFQYFSNFERNLERLGHSRRLEHKTVCENELYYNQPIESVATAFLIDKNHVMTVGHAITSNSLCRERFFFSFKYEWQADKKEIRKLFSDDIYFCEEIVEHSYSGIDYAIIKLSREVENIKPLELDFNHQSFHKEEIYTIGHPLQLPKKISTGKMRLPPGSEDNYYTAELDSFRGNSGSPVFSETTNKVIGILKDGERDFKLSEQKFCYMFNICPEDGRTCRGEKITRLDKIPLTFFDKINEK